MTDPNQCAKKTCCIKKLLGLAAVAVIAFLVGTKYPCGAGGTGAYKIGDVVPATSFADINGKTHNLADFKGKIVVLEWTNPNCPFVKKFYSKGDMPKIQTANLAKGKNKVVWIAINSGAEGKEGYFANNAEAKKIVAKMGFKGTAYVRDPSGALGKQFGAKTTPHMFVIDATGKLAYQGAIDSVKSFDQADIAGATNYVSAAIDALLAGKAVEPASTESYGCGVKY